MRPLLRHLSGFTKLTNRLLKERGDEGAEIPNNIICRFFEELILDHRRTRAT